MKGKRIIGLALSLAFILPVFAGCGGTDEPDSGDTDGGGFAVDFTELWSDGFSYDFADGETYTLEIGAETGSLNYIKFDFETEIPLSGVMSFTETDDPSVEYEEEFYWEAGDTEFRQILDYYHTDQYEKTLESLTFTAVDGGGALTLSSVSCGTHPIDFSGVNFYNSDPTSVEDCMQLYLTGDTVKLGVNLKWGGAINHLSSVNQGIAMYSEIGEIYVGDSVKSTLILEDDVNLINQCDPGRLVQQSYYGTLGDSLDDPQDDYVCGYYDSDGDATTEDVSWPYNPVQGGDSYANFSQLVDVQYSDTEIYIKVRPMDWAKNGEVTRNYMENTYVLLEDNVYGEYIQVRNTDIDFSGYAHNNVRDQELPAYYGITPLGRLATYKGATPWTEASYTYSDSLGFWSPGTSDNRFNATENWIAWLNEDNWGVGLYVPDVKSMVCGRFEYSVDRSDIGLDPSIADRCTYAAPLGQFSLESYSSFSYTYYLKVDYLVYTRALFYTLHDAGASNDELTALGV